MRSCDICLFLSDLSYLINVPKLINVVTNDYSFLWENDMSLYVCYTYNILLWVKYNNDNNILCYIIFNNLLLDKNYFKSQLL